MKKIKSTFKLIWPSYRWTFLGGIVGIVAAAILKFVNHPFLNAFSNLSTFFQIVSCALLSYLLFHIREKSLMNDPTALKKVNKNLIICLVVAMIILYFTGDNIFRWIIESVFGIEISYAISASDLLEAHTSNTEQDL